MPFCRLFINNATDKYAKLHQYDLIVILMEKKERIQQYNKLLPSIKYVTASLIFEYIVSILL